MKTTVPPPPAPAPPAADGAAAILPTTLAGLFPGRLWQVAALVAATLATLLLSMVPAFALGLLIDTVFERRSVRNLYWLLAALVLCHLLEAALTLGRDRLAATIERARSGALKERVLDHLERASLAALEATPAATVYNRMRAIGPIVAAYLDWYVTAISRPLFFLIAFCWLFVYSGMLGAAILALTLVYVGLYWLANRQLRSQYLQDARRRDRRSHLLHEFAQALPMLRIAGMVRRFYAQMATPARRPAPARRARLSGALLAQLTETYARFAFIGVLGAGAELVLGGEVGVGHLVAVIVIFRRVLSETRHVIVHIRRYHRTRAACTVIDGFLAQLAAPDGAAAAGASVPAFDAIVLEGAGFRYPGAPRAALHGIDLRIGRGQMVAIVGAPGSGKTSLLKLLAGLYPPSAGALRFDGGGDGVLNYSFMARSDMLFNRSIHQNIAFDRERSTADIVGAAKGALAHEFIGGLDGQYRARLVNGGHDLSPGLRQRLALARCIAADAALLLLDDPTGALDPDSERRVLGALLAGRGERTIVLVTDRAALALASDHVVVLAAGRVVDSGAPARLREAGGAFAAWCGGHAGAAAGAARHAR